MVAILIGNMTILYNYYQVQYSTNVTSSTEINNNRASALIVLFFRSFINGHEESKRTINNIYILIFII